MDINTNMDSTERPKLCINCKHIGTNSSGDWKSYKCFAPQNFAGVNLVTGAKLYATLFCEEARQHNNRCGALGDWYDAAPPKPVYIPVDSTSDTSAKATLKIKVSTNLLQDLGM